jgi:autoinducer 2-degrading protein
MSHRRSLSLHPPAVRRRCQSRVRGPSTFYEVPVISDDIRQLVHVTERRKEHGYAKAGNDEDVAAILRRMIPISRAESGCVLYIVNRSINDPRRFLLYEQYHDRAGYEAHMATDAFKQHILGSVVGMLESRVRDFYERRGASMTDIRQSVLM